MTPAPRAPGDGFLEAILRALEKGQRREGRYYFKEDIPLDGYVYDRCHFDSCSLRTATGDIDLRGCKITACTLRFSDRAQRSIKLYNIGAQWEGAPLPLRAVISDGLFTITGGPGHA